MKLTNFTHLLPRSTRVFCIISSSHLLSHAIWTSFYHLLNVLHVKSLIKTLPKFGQRGSWIAGMFVQLLIFLSTHTEKLISNAPGNLMEMFDAGNLAWHQKATQKYGGAVQFNALLGVRHLSSSVLHRSY